MKFQISDEWRITSDPRQWKVQRYDGVYKSGRRLNTPKWHSVAYCTSLASAARQAALFMLRSTKTDTPTEALAAVDRVVYAIELALERIDKAAQAAIGQLSGRPGLPPEKPGDR